MKVNMAVKLSVWTIPCDPTGDFNSRSHCSQRKRTKKKKEKRKQQKSISFSKRCITQCNLIMDWMVNHTGLNLA